MLAAEALIIPSGLFVAALLARQLPLEDYGRFTLAITLVTWIEWSLTALFARSTIKLVSEADDPRAVSATILRTYAATSVLAALVLVALAPGIGTLMGEPRLAPARARNCPMPMRMLRCACARQNNGMSSASNHNAGANRGSPNRVPMPGANTANTKAARILVAAYVRTMVALTARGSSDSLTNLMVERAKSAVIDHSIHVTRVMTSVKRP